MDLTKIAANLGSAVEEIAAQDRADIPQFVPATAQGKRGYDHVIDAMNRLPRPIMALGSLAIFAVAAISPTWFEARMQALAAIPDPMWWLLGAVMTCFFGAREAHYIRQNPVAPKH
ncbi:MAG: 3TM-type holin [Paracoccaceae bacterium]